MPAASGAAWAVGVVLATWPGASRDTVAVAPAATSEPVPPFVGRTSTRPSATCTVSAIGPTFTVKVVPFTIAASSGVSTRKCLAGCLSTWNRIEPRSWTMRVMPGPASGATVMRLLAPSTIFCAPLDSEARPPAAVVMFAPTGTSWFTAAGSAVRPGAATRTVPLTSTSFQSAAQAALAPRTSAEVKTAETARRRLLMIDLLPETRYAVLHEYRSLFARSGITAR